MKDIELLKSEQKELKEKLIEVINFTNSEEYYSLSASEKNLIGQQRAGMEIYLTALTNRIYGNEGNSFGGISTTLPLLLSMFSSYSSPFPSSSLDDFKKIIAEKESKENVEEEQ